MEFIGREEEMARLEYMAESAAPGCVIIAGRPGSGKSALIREFCSRRRSVYIRRDKESFLGEFFHVKKDGSVKEVRGTIPELVKAAISFSKPAIVLAVDAKAKYIYDEAARHSLIEFDEKCTESMIILSQQSAVNHVEWNRIGSSTPRGTCRATLGPMSPGEFSKLLPPMSDHDAIRAYLMLGGLPGRSRMVTSDTFNGFLEDCVSDGRIETAVNSFCRRENMDRPEKDMLKVVCLVGEAPLQEIMRASRHLGWADRAAMIDKLCRAGLMEVVRKGTDAPLYRPTEPMAVFRWRVLSKCPDAPGPRPAAARLAPEIGAFMRPEFTKLSAGLLSGYGMKVSRKDVPPGFEFVLGSGPDRVIVRCDIRGEELGKKSVESAAFSAVVAGGCPMIVSASGFDPEAEDTADELGATLIGPDQILGRRPLPAIARPSATERHTMCDMAFSSVCEGEEVLDW